MTSEPLVSIGLPVRNGELLIGESLECLINQTYKNIEILVFDNCSTDATCSIVEEFMAKDCRIKLFKQSSNIGAIKNFESALNGATGSFFMWRAYDDISSLNYVELLLKALQGSPEKELAVPSVVIKRTQENLKRVVRPRLNGIFIGKGYFYRAVSFKRQQAGWFYGLYKKDSVLKAFGETFSRFHHPWASDHLFLSHFSLNGTVIGVEDAQLMLRLTGAAKEYDESKSCEKKLDLIRDYYPLLANNISRSKAGFIEKSAIRLLAFYHLHRRVVKLLVLLKCYLKRKR